MNHQCQKWLYLMRCKQLLEKRWARIYKANSSLISQLGLVNSPFAERADYRKNNNVLRYHGNSVSPSTGWQLYSPWLALKFIQALEWDCLEIWRESIANPRLTSSGSQQTKRASIGSAMRRKVKSIYWYPLFVLNRFTNTLPDHDGF